MIFNLLDSCWKQVTLAHFLKILLLNSKKEKDKPQNPDGANKRSEFRQFSKFSFPIILTCFHTPFYVFCRDVIVTPRIRRLGHTNFYHSVA